MSDDEILGLPVGQAGLAPSAESDASGAQREFDFDGPPRRTATDDPVETPADRAPESSRRPTDVNASPEPEHLRAAFDAHPELRRAWQEAEAYRRTFPTPEEAHAATAVLADLDRLDALFFSPRPEDHAELARVIASLDPAAFASLAQAMSGLATQTQRRRGNEARQGTAEARTQGATEAGNNDHSPSAAPSVGAQRAVPVTGDEADFGHGPARRMPLQQTGARNPAPADEPLGGRGVSPDITNRAQRDTLLPQALAQAEGPERPIVSPTPAQVEFFHATNAAAVQGVLDAIESQVERLLPEGVSRSARNRVVGEIYRELDATLQSNRQLAQQVRDAFRGGALDEAHQRAVVALFTGRARQALPAVAKRVLGEWTSTVVAASHDRRERQRAAERRVDIAGSGGAAHDGRRPLSPRDLDYARLSDADILNL